ncbi:MAG: BatD family protein [Flavobacteriales bacterium]
MRTLLAIPLILASRFVLAQDTLIQFVSPGDTVRVGEQFQVKWVMDIHPDGMELPDLKDFLVVSGPNKNSSTSVVNGTTSRFGSIAYELKVANPGSYTLPAMEISYKGEQHRSPEQHFVAVGEAMKDAKNVVFADRTSPPDGAMIVKLREDLGYIAIQEDGDLHVKKFLTPEQVHALDAYLRKLLLEK